MHFKIYKFLPKPNTRTYALCCPPRPQFGQCGCPPWVPGGARRVVPPVECRPTNIAYNPCAPVYPEGAETYKKYKSIFFFVCVPLILMQAIHALIGHPPHEKGPCRSYEYMRIRSKRFPWGEGMKSFFHNPHINHLPDECEVPELECD